jgi:hypothetical protein
MPEKRNITGKKESELVHVLKGLEKKNGTTRCTIRSLALGLKNTQ